MLGNQPGDSRSGRTEVENYEVGRVIVDWGGWGAGGVG